jgi:hypothetical protein
VRPVCSRKEYVYAESRVGRRKAVATAENHFTAMYNQYYEMNTSNDQVSKNHLSRVCEEIIRILSPPESP